MTIPTDQRPINAPDPRLWMLISPALPVGGYSYSQGLEQAVTAGWISNSTEARGWIFDLATRVLHRVDLPYLAGLFRSASERDPVAFGRWNSELLALRETAELRAEDLAMGKALMRLLTGLAVPLQGAMVPRRLTFAAAFVLACQAFEVPLESACAAYGWVWCENQVAAAVKLVPLGQTEGQRLLLELAGELTGLVAQAFEHDHAQLGLTTPGLAIASAAHETQDSRIFQS